jgi:hypothetical protein
LSRGNVLSDDFRRARASTTMPTVSELTPADMLRLAEQLGERPQSVIAVSELRKGSARAWLNGDLSDWTAAVVDTTLLPGELLVFGHDAEGAIDILHNVNRWTCVEAEESVARRIGELLYVHGIHVRYLRGIYFESLDALPALTHPDVRVLVEADLKLALESDESLKVGKSAASELIAQRLLAGAVVDRKLVSKAACYARTARYADVGVATLKGFQRRGFAAAAARLVMLRLRDLGLIPVWSTGESNKASIATAQKLEMSPLPGTLYVIPHLPRPVGYTR